VDKASQLPVPQNPVLKTKDQFRYIGKEGIARLDIPVKTDGRAIYGMDVKVPGMLMASIERCPVFGGKAQSFDATAAKASPASATSCRSATASPSIAPPTPGRRSKGRRALKVTWDEGAMAALTSSEISKQYAALAQQAGQVARNEGNAEQALVAAARSSRPFYQVAVPGARVHGADGTPPPTSCPTASTLWAPTQNPGGHQALAAKIAGVPVERVEVVTDAARAASAGAATRRAYTSGVGRAP